MIGAFGAKRHAPGIFTANSAGQVLTPQGAVFKAYGCGIAGTTWNAPIVETGGATLAATVRGLFPGMNLCRIACYGPDGGQSFRSHTTWDPFLHNMTSNGVAVVIEFHMAPSKLLGSGTTPTMSAYLSWLDGIASFYASNPYVMYQSYNEPGGGTGMFANIVQEYNTVRQYTNAMFWIEMGIGASGGVYGSSTNFDTFTGLSTMINVGFDYHLYAGGITNTVAGFQSAMTTQMNAYTSHHSATGVPPVICLEGGNSIGGSTIDGSANNCIQAAFTHPTLVGFTPWIYNNYSNNTDSTGADRLTAAGGTNSSATLSSYGSFCAGFIANGTPLPTGYPGT